MPLIITAGHLESTCVRERGRLGSQDWELLNYLLEHDFILVARSAEDWITIRKAPRLLL
jgi:hypothetical protein